MDFLYAYTGRERDEETGLYYYRARYCDAATGRFLSEDPIGFAAGDANLSRYVGNGPTNGTDPSGMIQPLIPPNVSAEHRQAMQDWFAGKGDDSGRRAAQDDYSAKVSDLYARWKPGQENGGPYPTRDDGPPLGYQPSTRFWKSTQERPILPRDRARSYSR